MDIIALIPNPSLSGGVCWGIDRLGALPLSSEDDSWSEFHDNKTMDCNIN
jgi:hypothetical protein